MDKDLEDMLREDLLASREFRGAVRTDLQGIKDHVSAVSRKADSIRSDLSSHEKSQEAHGMGASYKTSNGVIAAIAVAISGLSLLAGILARH